MIQVIITTRYPPCSPGIHVTKNSPTSGRDLMHQSAGMRHYSGFTTIQQDKLRVSCVRWHSTYHQTTTSDLSPPSDFHFYRVTIMDSVV